VGNFNELTLLGIFAENESGNDVAASRNAVQNNSETSLLITPSEATECIIYIVQCGIK